MSTSFSRGGIVLIACWSAKGGSGTTVVACGLALVLAEASKVVVADLAGDVPAVLGVAGDDGPGVTDWASAGPDVGSDGLARLQVDLRSGLSMLRRGRSDGMTGDASVADRLPVALASCGDIVVADCGMIGAAPARAAGLAAARAAVAASAGLSLLVIQPCYLALRRALAMPLRPSGVIVVVQPHRALGPGDVEAVLDVPVRARVPFDPVISRAVDAGLLAHRVPSRLGFPLRRALR